MSSEKHYLYGSLRLTWNHWHFSLMISFPCHLVANLNVLSLSELTSALSRSSKCCWYKLYLMVHLVFYPLFTYGFLVSSLCSHGSVSLVRSLPQVRMVNCSLCLSFPIVHPPLGFASSPRSAHNGSLSIIKRTKRSEERGPSESRVKRTHVRSSHQPNGTFMSHRPVSITSRLVQLTGIPTAVDWFLWIDWSLCYDWLLLCRY